MEYYPQSQPPRFEGTSSLSVEGRVAAAMKGVYLRMAIGLLITGLVAYLLSNVGVNPATNLSPYNTYVLTHSWVMWAVIIAEFALVFGINGAINRLSSSAAAFLFFLFALVNGLMLTPIFVIYTHTSIAKTFFITAGTFGAMSVYGYLTNTDLSKFGKILTMALIGLVIAILVNLFTKSSTLDWIISIVGVFLFVGLTAWDTQNIKRMAEVIPSSQLGKLATLGALTLYLDFINLFLFLLRFFGASRD